MKILYLIGNGFDIAQGFKTRYTDFYPYYVDRSIDSPAIKKICDEIGHDYDTWADLEYRFGQYSIEVAKDDFDDVYYDLSDSLRDYLKKETSNVIYTEQDINKFKSDFIEPFKYLSGIDQSEIRSMYLNADIHTVDVISFNYTDVLDKALPNKGMWGIAMGRTVNFGNVYHIHGVLNQAIILGVNDETQIANKDFVLDDDIKDLLVKPQSNESIRSLEAVYCQDLISRADVIILYGLSIGETDRIWWQQIGKRMSSNNKARVVIFKYESTPIEPTRVQKLGAKRRMVIDDFMDKMSISRDSSIRDRIYVSFDRTFLSNSH